MDANLTIAHIHEYLCLWNEIHSLHLDEEIEDSIVWNLTNNCEYYTTLAYTHNSLVRRCMNKMACIGHPPKLGSSLG
jgi:hypothetical protein